MEGNRDESEKCFRIALNAVSAGDKDKAIKFLLKAKRLYPSKKVEGLLTQLQHNSDSDSDTTSQSTSSSGEHGRPPDSSPLRQRRNPASRQQAPAASTNSNGDAHRDYTPEQQAAVNRIKQCKDFYEILGIAKDANEADVKKAYKKLALQFHPDKNKAPGSGEAFKAIGKAFAVLSDKDKRKKYDMYGDETQMERQSSRHSHHNHQHYYNNGWYYETRGFDDDDISPEDIFNMFFNGGFPASHVRRRQAYRSHSHHERRSGEANYTFMVQVLPILLLVIMSIFSSMFVSDPLFRLSRQGGFKEERRTPNDVIYFVKKGFEKDYSGKIHMVEKEVDEEYLLTLRRNCYDEKYRKERVIQQARYFGDKKMFESGKKMATPSCDKYTNMYGRIAGG